MASVFLGVAAQAQLPCWLDANCPAGAGFCNEKRATVVVDFPTGGGCTGTLVNNTSGDLTPYVLTAFHCLDTSQNWVLEQGELNLVNDVEITFRRETVGCNNFFDPLETVVTGGDFIAADPRTDMLLIRMDQRPPLSLEYAYAGWDNSDVQPDSGASIHHPGLGGSFKKISRYTTDPVKVNDPFWVNGIIAVWIKAWRVTFDDFAPERGSSGASLLDENNRVVGIASHASDTIVPPNCTAIGNVIYGRFGKAWDLGTTPSTRLEDWLDPLGLGVSTVDATDPCRPSYLFDQTSDLIVFDDRYDASGTITAQDNVTIASGRKVRFNSGDKVLLKPGFRAVAGSDFKAFIGGCNNPCSGSSKVASAEAEAPGQALMAESSLLNFPNPFRASTTIQFELAQAGEVSLTVHNNQGRLVESLVDQGQFQAGHHEVNFNGAEHPPGIYFVRLQAGSSLVSKKMLLIK